MSISKIKKRDGVIVDFDSNRVSAAIEKTMLAVNMDEDDLPDMLAEKVLIEIDKFDSDKIIAVEEVQDIIEKVLINEGQAKMAKAFILYRQKRTELRKLKQNILGKMDDSRLSVNGLLIAKSRYLIKDKETNTFETPQEMFKRVSKALAQAEKKYKKNQDQIKEIEEEFFRVISSLEFIPSGRILANAGTSNHMLYSSFVIPIEDSMKGIFKALYHKALIQRLGGGTGFSFSRLRPKGQFLETTSGYSSGPIPFIKLFDHASDLTVVPGNRKPANMGSLSVQHPDIIEFITMKDRGEIKNFNISVEMTDEFMEAVKEHKEYEIKNPATGEVIEKADANNIFQLIVTMAWKTGDPGVLFIDRINEDNPFPKLARIETTDPCGDQLLLPYDGGNLGAINLSRFVLRKQIRWKNLERTTKTAVRFLDNVIDLSKFPVKKIEDMVQGNRRIGLGVLGFADMLYKLRIPYDSDEALAVADKIMRFIYTAARQASQELAEEKGEFPMWKESIHYNKSKMRNCSLIAIAPTGARSILADTSPGIEPNFALGYTRKVLGSTEILHINKVLEEVSKETGKELSEEMVKKIIETNSIDHLELQEEIKRIFVTAHNIKPEWHVKMQATFQKHIDNAISKTINFPKNSTTDDIKKAFLLAYENGCKGITVYREGSLSDQIINIGG
ncbi:MAG: adenosylcobalamin-dependent ribonucleoside-diphosphate reductase [Nanoarchaeota archaeon]